MNIGIIGIGNRGDTILNGFIKNPNLNNSNVYIYDKTQDNTIVYKGVVNVMKSVEELIESIQVLILAIPSDQYEKWLEQYAPYIQDKLFVSIRIDIKNNFLKNYLQLFCIAIPNMGSSLGVGYTVICKNPYINGSLEEIVLEETAKIMSLFGRVNVIQEKQLPEYLGMIDFSQTCFFEIINNMSNYYETLGYDKEQVFEILNYIMFSSSQVIANELEKNILSNVEVDAQVTQYLQEQNLEVILNECIKKYISNKK